MKYTILVLIFVLTVLSNVQVSAKNDVNANKVQREIKRQERIERKNLRKSNNNQIIIDENDVEAAEVVIDNFEEEVYDIQEQLPAKLEPVYEPDPVPQSVQTPVIPSSEKTQVHQPQQCNPPMNNSDSDINIQNDKLEASDDDSGAPSGIVIWGILILVAWALIKSMLSRRCPNCKKMRGMVTVTKRNIGRERIGTNYKGSKHGTIETPRYSYTYYVKRKCRYCGHVEEYNVVEKD